MAKDFHYEAINALGERVRGTLSADSEQHATQLLFKQGLVAKKLEDANKQGFNLGAWRSYFERQLPTRELILFTQQFRTLFAAGISLPEIFEILHRQVKNKGFAHIVEDLQRRIREGESLQQAFRSHHHVFSPLYCSMVTAGENSGSLSEVLTRLIYLLEHEEKIHQKIESAVRYPKMVVAVMVGAFLLLLNFVIPQFASLYASARVELPLPTVIAIRLNEFCVNYWWLLMGIIASVALILGRFLKTEKGIYWKDSLLLKIPLIGTIVQKASIARFASIFSILQSSGISVLDSMSIIAGTVDNAFYKGQLEAIKLDLKAGLGIAQAMEKAQGFTPLSISLVSVGEKAGNLDEMLNELASHYDKEVSLAVEELTDWIGPLLIICLGIVVLFFALAIFLPMWDLVKFV